MTIKPADYIWAVGFFDGEGHAKVTGNTATLRVDGIHPDAVRRLAHILGGTVSKLKKRPGRKNRQCYRWSLYGKNAVAAAEKLLATRHATVKKVELEAVRDHKKYPAGTAFGDTMRDRANRYRNAEYR